MKRNLLLGLILISVLTFSQNSSTAKFKIGKIHLKSATKVITEFVGIDGTDLYITHKDYQGYTLSDFCIEKNLTLSDSVVSKDIRLTKDGIGGNFEFATVFNGKVLIFFTIKDKKSDLNQLYVQSINKESLVLNHDMKLINTTELIGDGVNGGTYFSYIISQDKSKIVIKSATKLLSEKKGNAHYTALDNELNILWDKDIPLHYNGLYLSVFYETFENDGNLFLVSIPNKTLINKKAYIDPNYNNIIIAITDNGKKITQFPVGVDEYFLPHMCLEPIGEDKLICIGFYSDKNSFIVKGCYSIIFDYSKNEIISKDFSEFKGNFINRFISKNTNRNSMYDDLKGYKGLLYDYFFSDITFQGDKGIVVSEQFYNGDSEKPIPQGLYHGSLIVISFDKNGKINDPIIIPKYQSGNYQVGNSYLKLHVNNEIYLIFNDTPKNNNPKEKDKIYGYSNTLGIDKNTETVLIKIDENYNLSRETLFNYDNIETLLYLPFSEQINDNEALLYCKKYRYSRIVRLTIK